MKNKQKGSIGLLILLAISLTFSCLLIYGIIWDFQRFSAVGRAETKIELSKACRKYLMSSINRIPQKCFPYIESFNVKTNKYE